MLSNIIIVIITIDLSDQMRKDQRIHISQPIDQLQQMTIDVNLLKATQQFHGGDRTVHRELVQCLSGQLCKETDQRALPAGSRPSEDGKPTQLDAFGEVAEGGQGFEQEQQILVGQRRLIGKGGRELQPLEGETRQRALSDGDRARAEIVGEDGRGRERSAEDGLEGLGDEGAIFCSAHPLGVQEIDVRSRIAVRLGRDQLAPADQISEVELPGTALHAELAAQAGVGEAIIKSDHLLSDVAVDAGEQQREDQRHVVEIQLLHKHGGEAIQEGFGQPFAAAALLDGVLARKDAEGRGAVERAVELRDVHLGTMVKTGVETLQDLSLIHI